MPSPFEASAPAGAYYGLLARVLPVTHEQKAWEPSDGPMPSLFVSHGAPPTLDDPQWLDDLYRWGRSMPKPRAIVIVSAHWENAPLVISGTDAGTPCSTISVDFTRGTTPSNTKLPMPRRSDDDSPAHSVYPPPFTSTPIAALTTALSSR